MRQSPLQTRSAQRGATYVEYLVVLSLVALGAWLGVRNFGDTLSNQMCKADAALVGPDTAAACADAALSGTAPGSVPWELVAQTAPDGSDATPTPGVSGTTPKNWYDGPEQEFRRWAATEIHADPQHPLSFLLEDTPSDKPRFRKPPSTHHYNLIGPNEDFPGNPRDPAFYVQAGHRVTKASGAPEFLGLQDAWQNQYQGIRDEGRKVRAIVERKFIEIGGIPVDKQSARQWEREGRLPPGTVERAPEVAGWDVDEWRKGQASPVPSTEPSPARGPSSVASGAAEDVARSSLLRSGVRSGARALGRVAIPVAIGLDVYALEEAYAADGDRVGTQTRKTAQGVAGGWAGAFAGAQLGAEAGAAVGVWFGGVGAVPGAIVGGIVGGIIGGVAGSWLGEMF